MTIVVVLLVSLGTLLAFVFAPGLDGYAAVLFALIVGVGTLSIALVRRMNKGSVAPSTCPECGGVLSAFAPYCKHCGARLETHP